jgi:hypothetical protein
MYDAIVIQNRIIEELTKEYSEYLEKEKEQIIDSYYGKIDGVFGYREEGQEYYNQTYNQDRITISETKRSIEGIGLNNQNK